MPQVGGDWQDFLHPAEGDCLTLTAKLASRQANPDDGCPIPALALTASACLVATCSVALLDDAMFLVVILAVLAIAIVTYGVGRLLAAVPHGD